MSDLSFLDNYKKIRSRLNGPQKQQAQSNVQPTPKPEPKIDAAPRLKLDTKKLSSLKVRKDPALRKMLRQETLLKEGITYCQALLAGAENVPKRIKLLILPILEEANFSWEELFGKNPVTKGNSRTEELVRTKWKIFKELHQELKLNPTQIAQWCSMDRTSVLYGLGKLERKRKVQVDK